MLGLLATSAVSIKPLASSATIFMQESTVISGKIVPALNATLYIDNSKRSTRLDPIFKHFPHLCTEFNISEFVQEKAGYYEECGVCRSVPGYSFDTISGNVFAFISIAKPNGTGVVDWYGPETLSAYSFETPNCNGTYYIDETKVEGRPVRADYVLTEPGLPGSKPETNHVVMDFLTYTPRLLPSGIFDLPDGCTHAPDHCDMDKSAAESAANMTFYLAHPLENTGQLANQDAGDLLGDTNFLCLYTSPGGSKLDDYDSISKYTLEVDTRWGAYSLCNGYPGQCLGSEKVAVGRQASTPCRANGGQCTNNSADFGNWFSLPKGGECKAGQQVSDGSCTWRILKREKTVSIDCLVLNHSFTDTCKVDGGAPFSRAERVFAAVFESDDLSKGGCPALTPPSPSPSDTSTGRNRTPAHAQQAEQEQNVGLLDASSAPWFRMPHEDPARLFRRTVL